jgi:formiminotetrahydrofolate cyclodeaminase
MSKVRAQGCEAVVMDKAVKEAVMAPVKIIQASFEGLELISESAKECRAYYVPDLLVSIELLDAIARGTKHFPVT